MAGLVVAMVMFSYSNSALAEVRLVAEVGQAVFGDGEDFQVGGNLLLFRKGGEIFVYDFVNEELVYRSIFNVNDESVSPDGRFVAWSLYEDGRSDIIVYDVAFDEVFAATSAELGFFNKFPKVDAYGRLFWSEMHDNEGARTVRVRYLNLLTGVGGIIQEYSDCCYRYATWISQILVNKKWLVVNLRSSQSKVEVFSLSNFAKVQSFGIDDWDKLALAGDEVVVKHSEATFDRTLRVLNIKYGAEEKVPYDGVIEAIGGLDSGFLMAKREDDYKSPPKGYVFFGDELINPEGDADGRSMFADGETFLYQVQTPRYYADEDDWDMVLGLVKIYRDIKPEPEPTPLSPPAVRVDVSGGPCFIGATASGSDFQPELLPLLLIVLAGAIILFAIRNESEKKKGGGK